MSNPVAAVSMCKDELDIAEAVLRHMATQVDFLIVADNNSTDGTRDLLSDLSNELPLTVIDDPEVGYYQSKKMTDLAKVAKNAGADWVVPMDFDEVWYSKFGTVKEVLNSFPHSILIATANLYDHVASSEDDPDELNPVKRIGWRRVEKGALPKVACRYRDDLTISQGNHGAVYNGHAPIRDNALVIRHFPYRSPEQMIRKSLNGAAAYAATDLPEYSGSHWRQYGGLIQSRGEEVFTEEVYKVWFYEKDPRSNPAVIYDPAPIMV